MLNNRDFVDLERRLWREGNPLCDELVSTRDELQALLKQACKVIEKYSKNVNQLSTPEDLEFFREWDNFIDYVDNVAYSLGDSSIQRLINEGYY